MAVVLRRQSHFVACRAGGGESVEEYRTHVLEVGPGEGDAGTGLPVVMVHGLTRNHRDFLPLAERLAGCGRVSWCVDVVGRGESDRLGDAMLYGYQTYIPQLLSVVEHIGRPRVQWVGTSMGGLIGMLVAGSAASPIEALVLNDIGPFVSAQSVGRLIDYVGKEPSFDTLAEVEAHMRTIFRPYGELSEAHWRTVAEAGVRFCAERQQFVRAYDPRIAAAFSQPQDVDLFHVWRQIKCPVLLLHGTQSDIISADTIRRMHDERHPDAPPMQVHTVDNVGHAPALLDDDQLAVIAGFLNS